MVAELQQQSIYGRFVPTKSETRVGINHVDRFAGGHRWWIEDGEDLHENEILEMLSTGLLYKEISDKLGISSETVRKHVYHIYEKLHVSNRIEAVNKYFGR